MSTILTPGYLRWDGTKYVLDHDVEIVGPAGTAGPTGATGPQGVPGIGVGASATGDLSGTYPGPMTVVGLTGVSGVVSFGASVTNPTITQAGSGATGQAITLKAQAGTTGGNVNLQSGTGTTPGLVQFLIGNTTVGYFDTVGNLRIGPNNSSSVSSWIGSALPLTGTNSLYSLNANSSNAFSVVSGSSTGEAIVDVVNAGGTATGGRFVASGTGDSITAWQSNFIIEQVGSVSSALLFSKVLSGGTNRGTLARLYQTGALGLGDGSTNNTSTLAQAGLSGPVLNLAPATGTFTSSSTQALLFNIAGSHHVQGGTDVRFDVGTTLAGYFDSNRVFRAGVNPSTNISVLGGTNNEPGNGIFCYNASGFNTVTSASGNASTEALVSIFNTAAGGSLTTGLRLVGAGSANGNADWVSNGIIEQVGESLSALVFSSLNGAGASRVTTGKLYRSGAWTIGSTSNNNSSSGAQAGLTGPLLNISASTGGTLTSAANQAVIFNVAGQLSLHGNTGVTLLSGITTVASTNSNKFITSLGRRIKVTSITSGYTVLATDEVVSVGTLVAPITVTLPASPTSGDTYVIKDANGSASTFNITVSGNGNNIDAASTTTISSNYTAIRFVYNGTKWMIV